jgi:hypothetical protein
VLNLTARHEEITFIIYSSSLRTEHRASRVPRHPRLLFQFLGSIRHLVGLLRRGISPAQGLYLHRTTQHRKTQTNIHAPIRIQTCDPNVREAEDSTCLRPAPWRNTHCLIKHHAMKVYLRSRGIAPHILKLGTRWRWVVSITPRPLYSQGKSLWYPVDRRLGRPQSWSGRGGEQKIPAPAGNRIPVVQRGAFSLYWLSYRGSLSLYTTDV